MTLSFLILFLSQVIETFLSERGQVLIRILWRIHPKKITVFVVVVVVDFVRIDRLESFTVDQNWAWMITLALFLHFVALSISFRLVVLGNGVLLVFKSLLVGVPELLTLAFEGSFVGLVRSLCFGVAVAVVGRYGLERMLIEIIRGVKASEFGSTN